MRDRMKLAIIVAMEKEIELLIKYYEAKEISSTSSLYDNHSFTSTLTSKKGS